MSDREAKAIVHLVRAKQLLADLDRDARTDNINTIRAGVKQEVSEALEALQSGAMGNRDGKVRANAATTSRGAAKRIKVKSGTQRGRVLMGIAEAGTPGATDYELVNRLHIRASSLRPRRGELVDEGYVRAVPPGSGKAHTREHDGSDWTVWELTASGLVLARSLARELGAWTLEARLQPPRPPDGEQLTLA